jgi:hypothetical protein
MSAACTPTGKSKVVTTAIPNLDVMMHLIADAFPHRSQRP